MRYSDTSNGSTSKYWEDSFTDDSAAEYMMTYGEGPDSPLRYFIASLLNNGESVLDVGCGPGWNFDHFMTYGPSVSYKGLDYSKRFIKIANERIEPLRAFEVGDVRAFGEPDKSWDVVLLQDVLEHTNGYEIPLREALRVARKRILVTFWRLTDNDDPHINEDGGDTYGAAYDKREWEKHLDSLDLFWIHDELPRQNDKHDIYIIDLEIKHGF